MSETQPPHASEMKEITPCGAIPIKNFSVMVYIIRPCLCPGLQVVRSLTEDFKTVNDDYTSPKL